MTHRRRSKCVKDGRRLLPFLLTLIISLVIMNSGGDDSFGLDGGLEVPRPNIPFTLSFRLSLLACLFILLAAGGNGDTSQPRLQQPMYI